MLFLRNLLQHNDIRSSTLHHFVIFRIPQSHNQAIMMKPTSQLLGSFVTGNHDPKSYSWFTIVSCIHIKILLKKILFKNGAQNTVSFTSLCSYIHALWPRPVLEQHFHNNNPCTFKLYVVIFLGRNIMVQ